MNVKTFLDGLQSAGYWRERCEECGATFDAPNGEELCPDCAEQARLDAEEEAAAERQDLLDVYSDLYKDLNGFRPRGQWMLTCPVDELRAEVNRVAAELEEELREERIAEALRLAERDPDEEAPESEPPPCCCVCGELMGADEVGDETPAERVCDACAAGGESWSYTPATC